MSLDLNGSLNSQQHAGQQERKSSTQSEIHVKTQKRFKIKILYLNSQTETKSTKLERKKKVEKCY